MTPPARRATGPSGGARYDSDDTRWAAVLQRDRGADGVFYYLVTTTGVYCRPSCPARRPHRAHVRFCSRPEEAEAAGFRPCQRCRPRSSSLAARHAAVVAAACRAIEDAEAEAEAAPTLADLAAAAGLSRFYFQRVFKAVTGITPKAYLDARRAQRVRDLLGRGAGTARTGNGTITEALYNAGFNSSGRFYAQSSQMLGMTPSRFRAGGAGVAIRFAVGECSLGALLVAASAQGLCAVLLGDRPEDLVREFQDRFPNAELIGGDADFEQWVARVVGLIENPASGLELPLDVRGTAFQQRVWDALRHIPPGSTATYAEIAARIGAPRAVRATARACASNPLAVAIPCHRVVRSDGALGGYRWGVERKAALLAREARSS